MSRMLPVAKDHESNRRDDDHRDFKQLREKGLVRDKQGREIRIDKPHVQFSALDRDRLYQGYCKFVKSLKSDDAVRAWIKDRAGQLGMSVDRAVAIINEGNGQWPGENMQWWRGVSVGT